LGHGRASVADAPLRGSERVVEARAAVHVVQDGRILTQIAEMPDGRSYFWIARTVGRKRTGYGMPTKTFAIGLGCKLRHARRLSADQRP
jgi:predicted transcriptional regulator